MKCKEKIVNYSRKDIEIQRNHREKLVKYSRKMQNYKEKMLKSLHLKM